MNETRYPLCWPSGWKRTSTRIDAPFGKQKTDYSTGEARYGGKARLSMSEAIDRLATQLARMGVKEENVIVSTNVPINLSGLPRGDRSEPSDPGVAVYWARRGKAQCMAIDRYRRVADNIAAIAATLEYMRGIERHGGGEIMERTFMGFAQLPAHSTKPWREVLQLEDPEPSREAVEIQFRKLSKSAHPDVGGTHERMAELNQARASAIEELQLTRS